MLIANCQLVVANCPRNKRQRVTDMLSHKFSAVASGVDMNRVRYAAPGQQLVQFLRPGVKAVVVMVAAIRIDLHPMQIRGARVDKGTVRLPERFVDGVAESVAKEAVEPGVGRAVGQLLQQG